MKYKFHLAKSSKKHTCPRCGRRTFVPYVDAEERPVNVEIYGRCDRENNCQYILYPRGQATAPTPTPQAPQAPMRLNVKPTTAMDTKLFKWALTLVSLPDAITAWQKYKVGREGDSVIFWQIDEKGEVHAGKIIPYGADGHRRKDTTPTRWAHKTAKYKPYIQGAELEQCFFGQHLLTEGGQEVIIVESEKTAVMMSIFDARGRTYLATGGSGNLAKLCERATEKGLFLHKKIILVPDNGQAKNWQKIGIKYGFILEDICEHCSIVGCDILDLNEIIRKEPNKILEDEKIWELLDKLNK